MELFKYIDITIIIILIIIFFTYFFYNLLFNTNKIIRYIVINEPPEEEDYKIMDIIKSYELPINSWYYDFYNIHILLF